MYKRCNDYYDCEDKSDENECQKVKVDEVSYKKNQPPFVDGEQIKINVSIYLMNINKIQLPKIFDAKFKLRLTWIDYRLEYHNLHHTGNLIEIETQEKLWIPPLRFSNTKDNKWLKNDAKTTMNIVKGARYNIVDVDNPIPHDLTELHEGNVFIGSENIVKYSREYQMEFQCHYNLRNYPFDKQKCTIDLQVPRLLHVYMDLKANTTENWGSTELAQFVITDIDIHSINNKTLVQCIIHMKRIPLYHIATIYLPTLCIIFMALITLYIDQSHFEATVMVALTCMLVMHTLFQSISESMPTTTYLTLLDIWLMFCLVLPFVVFTIEVVWELMDQKIKSNAISARKGNKRPSEKSPLRKAKCILPTITIAFVTIYSMVVIILY